MAILTLSRDWGVDPSIVRMITSDSLSAITTNGYLNTQVGNINAINFGSFEWQGGDLVAIVYDVGEGMFTMDAVNQKFVPVVDSAYLPTTLTSAHIFVGNASNVATDVAVSGILAMSNTGATSIPLTSANILVGSAGNVAASVAMSGDVAITNAGLTTIQAGAVSSSKIAANVIRYAQVVVSAAQLTAMSATPVQIVAAGGASTAIVLDRIWIEYSFLTAQYASGGAIGLEFGNSATLGGVAASSTLAAATFNGYTVSTGIDLTPAGAGAMTGITNLGVFISNTVGAFTTGAGSLTVNVAYRIVAV